ncbi:MAG TPA: hypothetical protein VMR18_01760 [Candidatus Saccharimonadales bacterium]|nr:hypothetical protein [Candidatus Saccharimonadales bacterium]
MVLDSTVLMNTCHALTSSPASSGSVTISAAIAPVRYILVDNRGTITEILSNSQENVTPIVYKNKLGSVPITLSQAIYSQYIAIMTNIKARHNGVVYRRDAPIAGLVRLNSYQSILFRASHI